MPLAAPLGRSHGRANQLIRVCLARNAGLMAPTEAMTRLVTGLPVTRGVAAAGALMLLKIAHSWLPVKAASAGPGATVVRMAKTARICMKLTRQQGWGGASPFDGCDDEGKDAGEGSGDEGGDNDCIPVFTWRNDDRSPALGTGARDIFQRTFRAPSAGGADTAECRAPTHGFALPFNNLRVTLVLLSTRGQWRRCHLSRSEQCEGVCMAIARSAIMLRSGPDYILSRRDNSPAPAR